jgi:DNA-binding transcriptional MerR regulator
MVYSIEQASQLANVSRRRILIYCKQRLLSPKASPELAGYWFDADALRTLKRIEQLRAICDEPLAGVSLILDLTRELQRLRNEMRALEV